MKNLTAEEVLSQSKAALAQWEPRWEKNAAENGRIAAARGKKHEEFLLEGMGRRAVICANGPSLETAIPLLTEFKGMTDLFCCDKSFLHLVKAGLKPQICFVADAMISWEKYGAPVVDQTEETALVANVTANPEWAANWKGPVCFYVNRDNLHTERKFSAISGVVQSIPASSNVGNTAIVFPTMIMGYDRYMLVGYDMSWSPFGKYYAFDHQDSKRGYMSHSIANDENGTILFTSSNLVFSSKWLGAWIEDLAITGVDIRYCTPMGIVPVRKWDLRRQLEAAADAGPNGTRRWTPAEKQKYLDAKATSIIVPPQNFHELPQLLRQPNIQTVEVSLRGYPIGALARAERS